MKNQYYCLTLSFALGLFIQALADTTQHPIGNENLTNPIVASDSIAGIQKTAGKTPIKENLIAIQSKGDGTSRNLFGEKPQQPSTEIYAPSNARLRGFREMNRGFREMEQDEKIMGNEFRSEIQQNIEAYPNPANRFVKLKTPFSLDVEKVEVYTASGTLKATWNLESNPWGTNSIEVNTESLEAGTYIFRAYSNGLPLKPMRILITR
ncbi:hypothetical protein ADIS_2048 [Lunatimonas lonarensis]|uniref:Secretion system C-terminal sorting domain-containing protein n=1 Tax=Lunatimonas lonarensis TaxID=1232681 RepID=R7ZTZ2_9BACT|nr:T9SS type A sorting domain-containing protein [Lunatimonas lonarensis]EON77518.1 hypothetical protein ADIS_2048 [Lunatimonas lonarensis]